MNIRNLVISAILLAALAGVGWYFWRQSSTPTPPEIALDQVDPAMAEAVREAIDAVKKQPRSGSAWGALAMVLSANGFRADSPRCYQEATRFDPDNPAWPYLHGLQQLEVDPKQALPMFQQALSLNQAPDERALIHFRIALVLIEDGQLADAGVHLQGLRDFEPEGPRAQFLLALLALKRNDHESARKHLGGLLENPFVGKRAMYLLAEIVDEKQARTLQARAEKILGDAPWPDPYEEKLRSHYVSRIARLNRGIELWQQNRRPEALAYLRQVVKESPSAESCFVLGNALHDVGEYEEAEQMLRLAVKFEPTNTKSHFLIASCLATRAEQKYQEANGKDAGLELFRQAVTATDAALALKSELAVAHQIRGWSLKYLGRTDEALAALRQSVLIQPESPDMHRQLGEALAEAMQWKEALEHLQYAVQFARPGDERPQVVLRKWQAKFKEKAK